MPNAPFLYPLKIWENLLVLWCFQRVERGCIRNKWVKVLILNWKEEYTLENSFSSCFPLSHCHLGDWKRKVSFNSFMERPQNKVKRSESKSFLSTLKELCSYWAFSKSIVSSQEPRWNKLFWNYLTLYK